MTWVLVEFVVTHMIPLPPAKCIPELAGIGGRILRSTCTVPQATHRNSCGMRLAGSPADFGKLVADDTEKWGKVIRAADIKVE
jgi:hypothetical protein